jgi:triacylglycerol lipase
MRRRSRSQPPRSTPRDVVLLVPGFFGFARLGLFSYFSERVGAAIRGAVGYRSGLTVPVVPLALGPADALERRQVELLAQIRRIDDFLGCPSRLHLVGHSAGGVDAYLLTCSRPLTGRAWSAADDAIRRRIRSVTTVASPFRGTSLTGSAAARFAVNPFHGWASFAAAARMALRAGSLEAPNPHMLERAASFLVAAPEATRLCTQLLLHRELISALEPQRMAYLMADNPRALDVRLTNFVTVVPRSDLRRASVFFADLWRLTAGPEAAADGLALASAIELLNRNAPNALRPAHAAPPQFDVQVNDGVVNSARQLAEPHRGETFGGILVADHADVLGYYDGVDALVAGPALDESVFRSGAGFSDDHFFELYERVAHCIVGAMGEGAAGELRTGT